MFYEVNLMFLNESVVGLQNRVKSITICFETGCGEKCRIIGDTIVYCELDL
jgi:hypothetical protein